MKEKIGQRWRYNGNYDSFVVEVIETIPTTKEKVVQRISGNLYYVGRICELPRPEGRGFRR
jgi:hypothetical protein